MTTPNTSTRNASGSTDIKGLVSIWLLPFWLTLEGAMHGWAFSVEGVMPTWMTAGFSTGRSVLAYAWWRADRSHSLIDSTAPGLPGWIILWSWGGTLFYLVTRKSKSRKRSTLRYLAYTMVLSAAYLCAGGLIVLAIGNPS